MATMSCIVYGCPNNSFGDHSALSSSMGAQDVQFYSFPKYAEVAQQWIEATGWQPEHVDPSVAKICSMHFAEDSYTTEIKIIDYMTCYTKILKYDAIPTLYLPSTTAQIVIKQAEISADDGLQQMIVFAVPEQQSNTNTTVTPTTKNYIELQVQQTISESHQNDSEKVLQIERYTEIKTLEDLNKLEINNKILRADIVKTEASIQNYKTAIETQTQLYKRLDLELANLRHEYLCCKRKILSLSEQKRLLAKVFSESQIKILSGKKKIYWSNDDMAVGYTIRHLSNRRCYLYLTKNLNVPLPAVSSIKRWMTIKNAPKKSLVDKSEVSEKDNEHNSD